MLENFCKPCMQIAFGNNSWMHLHIRDATTNNAIISWLKRFFICIWFSHYMNVSNITVITKHSIFVFFFVFVSIIILIARKFSLFSIEKSKESNVCKDEWKKKQHNSSFDNAKLTYWKIIFFCGQTLVESEVFLSNRTRKSIFVILINLHYYLFITFHITVRKNQYKNWYPVRMTSIY